MKMQNVVRQATQKANHLQSAVRIINIIAFGFAMAGDVDDKAADLILAQKRADCDQITLYAAMRRRVRSELKDSHGRARRRFSCNFLHIRAFRFLAERRIFGNSIQKRCLILRKISQSSLIDEVIYIHIDTSRSQVKIE